MNIAKLKKLKKWILDEPRRYNQNTWVDMGGKYASIQNPPCGTVACLAGSACLMEGYVPIPGTNSVRKPHSKGELFVADVAAAILKLNFSEQGNFFALNGEGWDSKASRAYKAATTPKQRAKAAAMAIDALIKQGSKKGRTRRV